MLVRWCPDVVSVPCGFQSVVIFGVDVASSGAQNVSFGMLGASNLTGGPSNDSGGLGSTRRETLGSRFQLLSIFGGFRDCHLRVAGQFWHKKCVFCYACLQVTFFSDFGV